jgi:hypothetical protein
MSDLYAGTATFSMPNGPTVDAEVNLWMEEHGPLVEWGGTAEAHEPGILWNGGQQVAALRFGSIESGFHTGDCIIETVEPGDVERVTLRGSGELAEVDSEQ